jgi:putative pyrimidine permease RutG
MTTMQDGPARGIVYPEDRLPPAQTVGHPPKLGAVIQTIPLPVIGGLSFVVFGIISTVGVGIGMQNGVSFTRSRTLITVGAALVAAAGNLTLNLGGVAFGGIASATFLAIVVYHGIGLIEAEA